MSIKVCKFGGSSVADAAQLKKVHALVEADDARRIIVPSAPGKRGDDDVKVTDQLYRCRELAAAGEDLADAWAWTEQRYRSILEDLGLELDLTSELDEVRRRIEAGASADYVASRGEYLNGHVDPVEAARSLHLRSTRPTMIRFDADGSLPRRATPRRR